MTLEVRSVTDLLAAIEKTGIATKPNAHVRLWLRGQKDKSWKLSPGVYRSTFPANNDEAKRLWIERHLSQEFRIQSAGVLLESRDDVALYFLQQHYKMPTRLLDWTTNPLAALHFAVGDEKDSMVDGMLFIMDAYNLAVRQKVPADVFRGIGTSRNRLFRKGLQPILDWNDDLSLFPTFIMPVRPDHFERRVMLQKGCFTFHPPNKTSLTNKETETLVSCLVPSHSKPSIRRELALLGIDEFAVYGDLDSLAARLKFAYGIS
jgi:hypothetical protein